MNIIIVTTYPVYHDFSRSIDIRKEPYREHQLARILSEMGIQAELWFIGDRPDHLPPSGNIPYAIRLFKASQTSGPTKTHISRDMLVHAERSKGDLFLLKGVDGGSGIHLLKKFLIPQKRTFGFIIGGHCQSPHMKHASVIFHESDIQKQFIIKKHRIFRTYPATLNKLIRLPKSIDTQLFSPRETCEKRWDVLMVGRLISRYKNYQAAGTLSGFCRVAVAGGGPEEAELKKKYPRIHWLGEISHASLPDIYTQSRLFMMTSFMDYSPRVLAEAMSCGIPCVAFSKRIGPDVLPPDCGLTVHRHHFVTPVMALLDNPEKINRMGKKARALAVSTMGRNSCLDSLKKMISIMAPADGGELKK